MAKPRLFISSTFYDLKQVRADIELFVNSIGYEPVLNERGHIPYGVQEKLDEYCYKEIGKTDILVSIIGGRFGSTASEGTKSISQAEVKTALNASKPVYIFVDAGVLSEYEIYKQNKDLKDIKYSLVDNLKVFEFLDELYRLPRNNPIAPFTNAGDITSYLKEQLAGLFQRLLQEQVRQEEAVTIKQLSETASTLGQLVKFLTEERRNSDVAIQDILLSNHPAFGQLARLTRTKYRLYFTTKTELDAFLTSRHFEEDLSCETGSFVYEAFYRNDVVRLSFSHALFDENGKLKVFTASDWKPEWITREVVPDKVDLPEDDDIPF